MMPVIVMAAAVTTLAHLAHHFLMLDLLLRTEDRPDLRVRAVPECVHRWAVTRHEPLPFLLRLIEDRSYPSPLRVAQIQMPLHRVEPYAGPSLAGR
jgi:hypothetical protein